MRLVHCLAAGLITSETPWASQTGLSQGAEAATALLCISALLHFVLCCSEVQRNVASLAAEYSLVKNEAAIKLGPATPLNNLVPARLLVLASNGEGAVGPAAGRSQC